MITLDFESEDDWPGKGGYRIIGIISSGPSGSVYLAQDLRFPAIHRLCVIKEMLVLIPDQKLRDMAIRNFEHEAEILATLSHPSIPRICDYFNFGNRAYLVMEYIRDRDLEALLNSTDAPLPAHAVRQWAIEICDALSYLHSHSPKPIIFRVMKPGHVMIDQLRHAHLVDFGLGMPFLSNQQEKIAEEKKRYSPERDVYDLGLTLFHVLTRCDPDLELPSSLVRPIAVYNPNVSAEFASVVERAISTDPEQRFHSASELKLALIAAGA